MSVTYPPEYSNEDAGGEEETNQPHDQKPAADVLKSFRESFELLKPWQQEGVFLERPSVASSVKKQTSALFTVMGKTIRCNEAGIIFCQDLLDLNRFLKLKKSKKDILQFINSMEKKSFDTQRDDIRTRNSIIDIQGKFTELLEIDSRNKKSSRWSRVFVVFPLPPRFRTGLAYAQVIRIPAIMKFVSMLSSIRHDTCEQTIRPASNYQDYKEFKTVIQHEITHLETLAHTQVINWDDLTDCLQNIKEELLKNDTVEIAEEELSKIMWMGDMCRTFVFELKKVQLEQNIVPKYRSLSFI